jgi:hypothetical protein
MIPDSGGVAPYRRDVQKGLPGNVGARNAAYPNTRTGSHAEIFYKYENLGCCDDAGISFSWAQSGGAPKVASTLHCFIPIIA